MVAIKLKSIENDVSFQAKSLLELLELPPEKQCLTLKFLAAELGVIDEKDVDVSKLKSSDFDILRLSFNIANTVARNNRVSTIRKNARKKGEK